MENWRARLGMEVEPTAREFTQPIFVVGCMRSGTTFLLDKLTTHPQLLKVGNELRGVWTDIGGAPCEANACLHREAKHLDPTATANMTAYFADYIQQSQRLSRYLMRWQYRRRNGAGAISYDWEHVIPVNKSTHLMNKIGYVQALFPQAKWVIIVREVMGQVASMKKFVQQNFPGQVFYLPEEEGDCWQILAEERLTEAHIPANRYPDNIEALAKMWLRLNHLAFQAIDNLPAEQVQVISYEELVTGQERVLSKVFSGLSLKPQHQPKVVDIAKRSVKPYNTLTSGNPLEKWKKHLTEEEQAKIQAVLTEQTAKYEYIRTSLQKHKISL
ncbi:MAG: sulfotransferase [Bacteroidia bacterium]